MLYGKEYSLHRSGQLRLAAKRDACDAPRIKKLLGRCVTGAHGVDVVQAERRLLAADAGHALPRVHAAVAGMRPNGPSLEGAEPLQQPTLLFVR